MQEALKVERERLQASLAEEEVKAISQQKPGVEEEDKAAGGEDELEVFMGQVAVQLEQDKVKLGQTTAACCPLTEIPLRVACRQAMLDQAGAPHAYQNNLMYNPSLLRLMPNTLALYTFLLNISPSVSPSPSSFPASLALPGS